MAQSRTPSVLFISVKNAGKSQKAAGLMSKIGGDRVDVYSAGTNPGAEINALSAEALREVGVDITANTPKPIDPQLIREVDVVVTLGRDARVPSDPGSRLENWDTDEPSECGIDGMGLIRNPLYSIAA
jgi:arsenate-mycothiol transferase